MCAHCSYRYKVREKLVSDGLLSVLQISDVQDSDFATYNCSAYSSNNSTYLPIKFSKKGSSFSPHLTVPSSGTFAYL